MAEVRRKKGESFDSMLRRFGRKVQESGRILQAKKVRFFARSKSKNAGRDAALRREYLREHREYLLKTGQKTEEDFRPKRGGRR